MENMKDFFAGVEEAMTCLGRGRESVPSDIRLPSPPRNLDLEEARNAIPEGTVLPEGLEYLHLEEGTNPPAISD